MNYKTIIRSQKIRFSLLKILSFIPDSIMLRFQYRIKLGRSLSIKTPRRYTEKIQNYKIFYRNPLMHICVDKYNVRNYVALKGLSHILNDLLGVYNSPDEINFMDLPNQFVIKTTDGGGGENIILCKNKNELDICKSIELLRLWLNKKDINAGREWAYTGMAASKIIIEKYLENKENAEAGISDYKIICFNGIPQIIILDVDRYIGHKRNFYDTNWNFLNISSDCPSFGDYIPKPDNLDELLHIAATLSEDFPHVRVDLYNLEGKIIFGELTFYPWSGYVQFEPDSFDFELGKKFLLSDK